MHVGASWVGAPIHVVSLTRSDYDAQLHRYWAVANTGWCRQPSPDHLHSRLEESSVCLVTNSSRLESLPPTLKHFTLGCTTIYKALVEFMIRCPFGEKTQ